MSAAGILTLGPYEVPGLSARRVRVFRPPAGGQGPPPVLYMFDGQNVFDDAPSFAGGWHLHEVVQRISARRHRLPVIVGIDHGGEKRLDELSPWPTRHGLGGADTLLAWMIGHLMPELSAGFGLAPGAQNVFVGGSSMGGLSALYAHFRHPEAFGGVLCMSPSFWVAEQKIFDFVASRPRPWASRIYLDGGAREAGGGMLRLAERMARHLSERGYGRDALYFRADPKGKHNESEWRRRAPGALRFLFGVPGNARR